MLRLATDDCWLKGGWGDCGESVLSFKVLIFRRFFFWFKDYLKEKKKKKNTLWLPWVYILKIFCCASWLLYFLNQPRSVSLGFSTGTSSIIIFFYKTGLKIMNKKKKETPRIIWENFDISFWNQKLIIWCWILILCITPICIQIFKNNKELSFS